MLLFAVTLTLAAIPNQIVAYEANAFPESEGWQRELANTPGAERSLENGWMTQAVDLPPGWTTSDGDADFYRMSLSGFVGVEHFFMEWRVLTDNPSWLLDLNATPVALAAGGR